MDSTSRDEEEREEELTSVRDAAPSALQELRTVDAAGGVSAAAVDAGAPHVPQVLVQFCVS